MAVLIFMLRRRLPRFAEIRESVGDFALVIGAMAAAVLLGVLLFAVRYVPGPMLLVGVVATGLALILIDPERRRSLLSFRSRRPGIPDWRILLAFILAASGVFIAGRTQWAIDVRGVQDILARVASGTRGGPNGDV